MLNFSLCLNTFFAGMKPADAAALAHEAGYNDVEMWRIDDADVEALSACLKQNNMRLVGICADEFDLTSPSMRPSYRKGLESALAKAARLGARSIITQVGSDNGMDRAAQHESIVEGLLSCVSRLEREDSVLLIEPLNTVVNHPGYYLYDSAEGFDIIREVNSPNVMLLYDVYHQLHMGEDVVRRIKDNLSLIGHFHTAGFPGRDEKLFEGYDYTSLMRYIASSTYDRYVGLELVPSSPEARSSLLGQIKRDFT